jgi:hypothetical protein
MEQERGFVLSSVTFALPVLSSKRETLPGLRRPAELQAEKGGSRTQKPRFEGLMLRDGDPVELSYFLVAFLDLLGQREQLRRLKTLPEDLRPDSRAIEIVKATLGAVHGVRSSFEQFFKAHQEQSDFSRSLPTEQREALCQLTHSDIIHYGFSDSIIVAVSLKGARDDPTPVNGVWSALFACCCVACISLASRHPLRGGIDVGLGARISEDEVYGPALERAYTLESRCAGYPRILVGSELLAYLDQTAGGWPSTVGRCVAATRAESARRFIFRDADGAAALDYLGLEFRSIAPPNTTEAVEAAYHFVRAEHGRMSASENEVLAARYERLKGYFDLRLPSWGINK